MKLKRMAMTAALAALLGGPGFIQSAMADAPSLSVNNVTFRQRYPWNGLVDIDCDVTCSDPATNISLYVSANDAAANKPLVVRSVWLENDATHTNALVVKSGSHRFVWDAGMDNPNFVGDAVTVEVQAHLGTELYLVIDLSGGKNAASYPISYIGAEPKGGWTDEYKTTKLALRRIQPGTVPTRDITLSKPFYIGVFEVTQRQYELVTGDRPSHFTNETYYATRPVECVSWNMIRGNSETYNWPNSIDVDPSTFIGKLRVKTGLDDFDLPTEAQWEYACRAGTTTDFNNGENLCIFDDPDFGYFDLTYIYDIARYSYFYNSGLDASCTTTQGTATVGSYKPNAWGLYDMHGNVWEWCLDWYGDSYGSLSSGITDPVGPSSGTYRIKRGGCWYRETSFCTSSVRVWGTDFTPSSSWMDDGFRLVRTPKD